jgi:hypothetical protein
VTITHRVEDDLSTVATGPEPEFSQLQPVCLDTGDDDENENEMDRIGNFVHGILAELVLYDVVGATTMADEARRWWAGLIIH